MNIYKIYTCVVEQGSFSAAAKHLHRSPSSISKTIHQLEERLNVQLFSRNTRNLSVTEAGRLYYERCLDITKSIDSAEEALLGVSASQAGTIHITWPNLVSSSNLCLALAEFSRSYPELKLEVSVDNKHINLIDQNIDFAFRLEPNTDSNMIAIELFRVEPVLCASPALMSSHGNPDTIEELEKLPFVLLNNANAMKNLARGFGGLSGLELKEHHRVNDINALLHMTRTGLGVSILFRHMVEQDLASGRLLELAWQQKIPTVPVFLMYHKNEFMPERMRRLIDFMKRYYLMQNAPDKEKGASEQRSF